MENKQARQVMNTDVVTVTKDVKLTKAMRIMLDHRVSGLPVVERNTKKLVGIITEHDTVNFAFSGDADATNVGEAMTNEVFTFSPDVSLERIVNCFATNRVRRVPIVEDQKVVGIVSRRDIMREMLSMYGET